MIAAAVAGAFDVGLFSLVMMNRDRAAQEILLAKTLGFSAAVIVRLGLYRRVMMSHVRSDQQRPFSWGARGGLTAVESGDSAYFEENESPRRSTLSSGRLAFSDLRVGSRSSW